MEGMINAELEEEEDDTEKEANETDEGMKNINLVQMMTKSLTTG